MKPAQSLVLACGAFIFATALSHVSFADDEHYSGYDAIVKDLSGQSATSVATSASDSDPMENVKFHASVGATASHLKLASAPGLPTSANIHGYLFSLGIDLFSPNWQAIGTVSSYDPDSEGNTQIQVREFGMLIQHKIPLENMISLLLSGGLSARYMDLSGQIPNGLQSHNTTPASVFNAGVDFRISPSVSVDVAAAYQAALVHDTADGGSIDGIVGLAGHF